MLGSIVSLLPRVVDEEDQGVTMDTLEAVTYLLQRMQVCVRGCGVWVHSSSDGTGGCNPCEDSPLGHQAGIAVDSAQFLHSRVGRCNSSHGNRATSQTGQTYHHTTCILRNK
jgi:hypothetical protein